MIVFAERNLYLNFTKERVTKMYEIAVCDDCKSDRVSLIKKIRKNGTDQMKLRIHEFSSGLELLNAMERVKFSVVFLDIQMPGLDGEKTARKLRELDSRLLLVFCTGFVYPNTNNFDLEVCRFIRKDMSNETIEGYIKIVLNKMVELSTLPSLLAYHYKKQLIIDADHIVYIEKYKKSTRIHLADYAYRKYGIPAHEKWLTPSIRLAGTLEEAYEKLKGYGFGCPHTSYIVNFSSLCTCTGTSLTLYGVDGDFSITRSQSSEFNKQKVLYMRQNSMEGRDSL